MRSYIGALAITMPLSSRNACIEIVNDLTDILTSADSARAAKAGPTGPNHRLIAFLVPCT